MPLKNSKSWIWILEIYFRRFETYTETVTWIFYIFTLYYTYVHLFTRNKKNLRISVQIFFSVYVYTIIILDNNTEHVIIFFSSSYFSVEEKYNFIQVNRKMLKWNNFRFLNNFDLKQINYFNAFNISLKMLSASYSFAKLHKLKLAK